MNPENAPDTGHETAGNDPGNGVNLPCCRRDPHARCPFSETNTTGRAGGGVKSLRDHKRETDGQHRANFR